MVRFSGQRGYTRFPRLIMVLLVAATGYFAATFWPVVRAHYRIKNDAKRMANRALQNDGTPRETHIARFLELLYEREGLVMTRSEVELDTSDSDRAAVKVHVELPYEYPLFREQRIWKTTIAVVAERARGF